jgi:phage tail-like protein
MRGTVAGLVTPHPLQLGVPAVFRDDPVTTEVLSGLDVVLAPVFATLDCLDAYLDPRLAPEDFLPWLASWVGLDPDQRWTDEQLRQLMRVTIRLYRKRGTIAGIRELVEAYTGVQAQVVDTGGCVAAPVRDGPGRVQPLTGDYPGNAEPSVTVAVTVPEDSAVTEARLRALVGPTIPAHVGLEIRVTVA